MSHFVPCRESILCLKPMEYLWSVISDQATRKKFNIFQGEEIIQATILDYNAEKLNANTET